MIIINNIPKST